MLLASLARSLSPRRAWRGFAVLAGLFAVFHGLDILPNIYLDWSAGAGWLKSWGRGGEWWPRLFQYPGHVTAVLWAPNHALPAWLGALLMLRHGRSAGFARGLALPFAGGAFFSPIGAAGAAVLAAAAALRAGTWRAAALSPANWLAAAFALPLCLYLTAGAEAVPHGFLWAMHPPARAFEKWALLLLVEVLPWAVLAGLLVRSWLLGAAVALLCLLPAYVFGAGNETASRGAQGALAVLAVVAGAALLVPARSRMQRWARAGLVACAALAAAGSATEGSLLVTHRPWPASEACNVPEAARQSVFRDVTDWSHYFARWPDGRLASWLREPWLLALPRPGEGPRCWPGGGV
jgi:hypothetical protein